MVEIETHIPLSNIITLFSLSLLYFLRNMKWQNHKTTNGFENYYKREKYKERRKSLIIGDCFMARWI